MMLSSIPLFVSFFALFGSVVSLANVPFHTSGRWVLDSTGARYKLRCVNWAGHLEPSIPEGLAQQPVDTIASWISSNGFNCVRLTYSIDTALNQDVAVSDSFTQASSAANDPSALQAQYTQATTKNPFLTSATRISTYATVLEALDAQNIAVILDNHVSKAQWCCNYTDGNGWWDTASGYNDDNSRYFNTTNWLSGLSAMANFASSHSNVIGMSLRNELRATGTQDENNHADWYNYVTQGATAIHTANPNLLIAIGGVTSATDLSYIATTPLAGTTTTWANRTIWEFHSYYFSFPGASSICDVYEGLLGARSGFLIEQNQPWTGPLWLSEFGALQDISAGGFTTELEQAYLKCLVSYMEGNDADWAVWALQGGYYLREGVVDSDESYGLLTHDWSTWRNATFKAALGTMFEMTQGP